MTNTCIYCKKESDNLTYILIPLRIGYTARTVNNIFKFTKIAICQDCLSKYGKPKQIKNFKIEFDSGIVKVI